MLPKTKATTASQKTTRASTLGAPTFLYNNNPMATVLQTSNLNPDAQSPPKGRTLVLAFDGTSNIFDETNTNVVKLFSLLKKDLPEQQLVYYQTGCGTYNANPGLWTPAFVKLAKIADLAGAVYIDAHICAGYKFLVDQYRTGDRICLFGFSRGAYTARCVAGMLHKVGLLTQGNTEQIPFAYEVYRDTSPSNSYRSEGFRRTFSRRVNIEFLGVWDTVSSVGILYSRHLPFTSSNSIIKTFRHALALDERRAKFKANVWHRSVKPSALGTSGAESLDPEQGTGVHKEATRGRQGQHKPAAASQLSPQAHDSPVQIPSPIQGTNLLQEPGHDEEAGLSDAPSSLLSNSSLGRLLSQKRKTRNSTIDSDALILAQGDLPDGGSPIEIVHDTDRSLERDTDVLEVWFAGCHSDVGGGSVPDWTANALSGPSLRWMIHEIIDTHPGILFDEVALAKMGIDPTPGAPRTQYKTSSVVPQKKASKDGLQPTSLEYTAGTSSDTDDHVSLNSQSDAPQVQTMSAEELKAQQRDQLDAISPIHDQLKMKFMWSLLELLPISWNFQDKEGKWHRRWRPNFWQPRLINNGAPVNIHVSVKRRMEAGIGYKPKAKFFGEPNWVE